MILPLATIVGGFLLSFTLVVALVALSLTTFRTLADRVVTRFRTILYGWERFPEMLFSNIEAVPLPFGHDSICAENLILDKLHTAKRYTVEGKGLLRHCEIYGDKMAVRDIATWVRAKAESEAPECSACLSLEAESENNNPQTRVIEPPVFDFGPSGFHGGPGPNLTI
jgi:hypothetical protein